MSLLHRRNQPSPRIDTVTSDIELVHRASNGEQAAFETIMRRNNQRLFRTARSILKSDADAEDATQEAYLHAWRALPAFRADAQLSTWLTRIVINESLSRRRRHSAKVVPLSAVVDSAEPAIRSAFTDAPSHRPEYFVMRAQLRKLMEARIDRLPDAFRTVFILRDIEEMSAAEVAEVLGIPGSTVRTRLFRARSLIREAMASDLDLALGDAFSFAADRCDRIVSAVLARGRAAGLCSASRVVPNRVAHIGPWRIHTR